MTPWQFIGWVITGFIALIALIVVVAFADELRAKARMRRFREERMRAAIGTFVRAEPSASFLIGQAGENINAGDAVEVDPKTGLVKIVRREKAPDA